MISVIIPVFNAEDTVARALRSVYNQSWQGKFEIIIINDGSTDRSEEVIKEFIASHPDLNFTYIRQDNLGVSAARNAGLRVAKGEYIALLDADDEWLPYKTEEQLKILGNSSLNIDFLAAQGSNKKILYPYRLNADNLAEITFRKLMLRNEAQTPSVIFKRKILDTIGFFDENQRHGEDINYWLRVSANHKMYIIGKKLVVAGGGKRTFGYFGLSADLNLMEKGFQKNLKEMLQSKRITYFEYLVYYVFYRLKYVFRILRSQTAKLRGR